MSKIPKALLKRILANPYYKVCARQGYDCDGRITLEHALIHAGRQVQEEWAIIPLCAFHHAVDQFQDGGDLNKEVNEFIAFMRATPEDFAKYPRNDWAKKLKYLIGKFQPQPLYVKSA